MTRAERKKVIPVGYAKGFLADILGTPPQLHPHLPLLAKATEISSDVRVGVYDCLYIALAEREGCQFVTADERLVRDL